MQSATTAAGTEGGLDFHALNACLNIYSADGRIQFDRDRQALDAYLREHVARRTVGFADIGEKITFLLEHGYYDARVLERYDMTFVVNLFTRAHAHGHRLDTFLGAYKFYSIYALKTFDGSRYLETYTDRVCMVALTLAAGDQRQAVALADEILEGRFQVTTVTLLNSGKAHRGESISCFLLRVEDTLESIARSIAAALQLSRRGGGVAFLLSNLRETGAPVSRIEGQAAGVIPVLKLLEDAFSYAQQPGSRQGAGAVYLHAHHPDILAFLDTKRENADEKIRIKSLSIGVVIPDITFELAKHDQDMWLFSPYDIQRHYGVPFSEIDMSARYRELACDERIRKTRISAREFFRTIAAQQFESGYPYILFEDNANRPNPIPGKITHSNLCAEILQVSSSSAIGDDLTYTSVGKDICCNLGSLNIAKTMDSPDFAHTIDVAIRALTAVSEQADLACVPTIAHGNNEAHAIGLGQMNLHGYLARERIHYGSAEAIDFTDIYFLVVTFHALAASNRLAIQRRATFAGFAQSAYATGEYFDKYIAKPWNPATDRVRELFAHSHVDIPTQQQWRALRASVMEHGLYNQNLQAVAPNGSIAYINNSTASLHPVPARIEIRKEGKTGRVYYPAPYMTDDNLEFYSDAYEVGYEKIIDTYAAATRHVDQGLSLTLFFTDDATTRDINKAQIYAWRRGIKTLYYIRIRQKALAGTEADGCVSCSY